MKLPKVRELLPDEIRQICRYARQLRELGLCDEDEDEDELEDELDDDGRFDRDELGLDPEEDVDDA